MKERKVGNFSRFYIYIPTHIFRGNYKIFFVVEKGKKKENNIKRSVLLKRKKIKKINNFSRRFFSSKSILDIFHVFDFVINWKFLHRCLLVGTKEKNHFSCLSLVWQCVWWSVNVYVCISVYTDGELNIFCSRYMWKSRDFQVDHLSFSSILSVVVAVFYFVFFCVVVLQHQLFWRVLLTFVVKNKHFNTRFKVKKKQETETEKYIK